MIADLYEEEQEWLSICCTAHPLFDLHHLDDEEVTGICGQCRDHTTFINYGEDDET